MTGSVVCVNACTCKYECVGGRGNTHRYTGHEVERGSVFLGGEEKGGDLPFKSECSDVEKLVGSQRK